jgi:hypothetical protein
MKGSFLMLALTSNMALAPGGYIAFPAESTQP